MPCMKEGVKQNPISLGYRVNVKYISMRATSLQELAFGVKFYARLCNMNILQIQRFFSFHKVDACASI